MCACLGCMQRPLRQMDSLLAPCVLPGGWIDYMYASCGYIYAASFSFLFSIACVTTGCVSVSRGHMNPLLFSCALPVGWIDCMYVLHCDMYAASLLLLLNCVRPSPGCTQWPLRHMNAVSASCMFLWADLIACVHCVARCTRPFFIQFATHVRPPWLHVVVICRMDVLLASCVLKWLS